MRKSAAIFDAFRGGYGDVYSLKVNSHGKDNANKCAPPQKHMFRRATENFEASCKFGVAVSPQRIYRFDIYQMEP